MDVHVKVDVGLEDEEMAKRRTRTASATGEVTLSGAVAAHAAALEAAGTDSASFAAAFARLCGDDTLATSDLAAVAVAYAKGGAKPTSRKAALAAIEKRFTERRRTEAKLAAAAKARPW